MKVLSGDTRFSGSRVKGRTVKLLLCGATAAAIASTAMGSSLASATTHPSRSPAAVPTKDIVGTGLVTCAAATGEVGYSPASIAGGTSPMMISVWFKATKCSAQPGTTASPVPSSIIGSISVLTKANACPLSGVFGTGTLNLTYNYPAVPNPMIDPSVATGTTLSNIGLTPFWTLTGQVQWGSYSTSPPTNFKIVLKPNPIGGENCSTGLTSEYIARSNGPLTNI